MFKQDCEENRFSAQMDSNGKPIQIQQSKCSSSIPDYAMSQNILRLISF